METDNEIDVIFILSDTTSTLQAIDQEVVSIFKSYYLRNIFGKAIAP